MVSFAVNSKLSEGSHSSDFKFHPLRDTAPAWYPARPRRERRVGDRADFVTSGANGHGRGSEDRFLRAGGTQALLSAPGARHRSAARALPAPRWAGRELLCWKVGL